MRLSISQIRTALRGSIAFSLPLLLSGCGGGEGEEWNMPVQAVVAPVTAEPIVETLQLVGTFQAADEADLVSELDAHITRILFDEGQAVSNSQPLFQLDATRPAARLDIARTEATLRTADWERGRSLRENGTISSQEYDRMEAASRAATATLALAEREMADTTLYSPLDGFVTEHSLSVGAYVNRGQVLASVVTLDPIEVSFSVPERYAAALRLGQTVAVSTPAVSIPVTGTVTVVSPRVDPNTRTLLAKARVPNPDHSLKPGMFGNLAWVMSNRENALTIPEASVMRGNNSTRVIVVGTNHVAAFRDIQTGIVMKDKIEVVNGLEAGEWVVVEGHQKMGPGSKVKVSPKSERYGINLPSEPPAPVETTQP